MHLEWRMTEISLYRAAKLCYYSFQATIELSCVIPTFINTIKLFKLQGIIILMLHGDFKLFKWQRLCHLISKAVVCGRPGLSQHDFDKSSGPTKTFLNVQFQLSSWSSGRFSHSLQRASTHRAHTTNYLCS